MTTIRFSASGYSPATTGTFTVSLGGTPSVGDLVVVYLGVDNEIVTHQPNFNNPTQWAKLDGAARGRNTSTLSVYQHTWTGADTGTTATFTLSPAPSLSIGDKDLSSANVLWVAVVLQGPTGASESAIAGSYDVGLTLPYGPLRSAHSGALVASYALGVSSFTNSDSGASSVQSVTGNGALLQVWQFTPTAKYKATVTASAQAEILAHADTFNDSPSFIYHPGLIAEGPVAEDQLFFRYTLDRYYTLLNNGGTFSQVRYPSTDDLNAATQVFTNNSPVTSTDRTNILNSGVGGEFVSA